MTPAASPTQRSFKGNKQSLPSKPCVACGRAMAWRKRWARCWDEVKFCSAACRNAAKASKASNARCARHADG